MANVMGLTVARDVHLPRRLEVAAAGLPPSAALDLDAMGAAGLAPYPAPPRGAALEGGASTRSDQAHFSIAKALDFLGFPAETLAVVPSDERFRLRGAAVAARVEADLAAGLRPLAIAGVAGTTNTGSVDATGELADVAARHGLWLHVDAAYGGAALLSGATPPRVPDLCPGRLDHDRPPQVVLPGLRHRRAPRPPAGRPRADVPPPPRVLPHRPPRGAAPQLVRAGPARARDGVAPSSSG